MCQIVIYYRIFDALVRLRFCIMRRENIYFNEQSYSNVLLSQVSWYNNMKIRDSQVHQLIKWWSSLWILSSYCCLTTWMFSLNESDLTTLVLVTALCTTAIVSAQSIQRLYHLLCSSYSSRYSRCWQLFHTHTCTRMVSSLIWHSVSYRSTMLKQLKLGKQSQSRWERISAHMTCCLKYIHVEAWTKLPMMHSHNENQTQIALWLYWNLLREQCCILSKSQCAVVYFDFIHTEGLDYTPNCAPLCRENCSHWSDQTSVEKKTGSRKPAG